MWISFEHVLYRRHISNEIDGVHYEDQEPRTTVVQWSEDIPRLHEHLRYVLHWETF